MKTNISTPHITVSIVTYNTPAKELDVVLPAVEGEEVVDEIYIIDNSSKDYIRDAVAKYPKCVYIPSANVGYGAAHNKAMRIARNKDLKYHLVLNSDIYFRPGLLERLIKVMEARPEVGQLHPAAVNADGTLQYSVRMLPSPFDLIFRRFWPFASPRDRKYLLKDLDHTMPHNLPYHQGSFLLFRNEALDRCGGFDERFFLYPEDIDITRRIHQHYVTLYYPLEYFYHLHKAASYHNKKALKIHIVNMCRYFNKWGWIFDKERRKINRRLRRLMLEHPEKAFTPPHQKLKDSIAKALSES